MIAEIELVETQRENNKTTSDLPYLIQTGNTQWVGGKAKVQHERVWTRQHTRSDLCARRFAFRTNGNCRNAGGRFTAPPGDTAHACNRGPNPRPRAAGYRTRILVRCMPPLPGPFDTTANDFGCLSDLPGLLRGLHVELQAFDLAITSATIHNAVRDHRES